MTTDIIRITKELANMLNCPYDATKCPANINFCQDCPTAQKKAKSLISYLSNKGLEIQMETTQDEVYGDDVKLILQMKED